MQNSGHLKNQYIKQKINDIIKTGETTMNDLNSILLEGQVMQSAIISDSLMTAFELKSQRTYKSAEGKIITEETIIGVITHGILARNCREKIKHGDKLRVVGRIRNYLGKIQIMADHIEIRPMGKTHEKD